MAPTVSSAVVPPPTPVPAHDATKIVIRQFRSEDLPQVIGLFKEGMLCYPAQRENPRLLQFIDDSLKTDLMDISGTYIELSGNYWIATPSDEPTLVVGMVGLEAKPNNEGELRRMSVKSSHRRFGVGRMLLSTLEHWAEENQFEKIWLSTGSIMQKARDFYIRAGYIETDEYFLPEDRPIYGVVKLEKTLTSSGLVCARC
ncbi:N-acetyltransferase family 8 member 2 [Phytophthora citrophthora]|uniref:N-acetyltransferase family 8 member 2 n=1 Tax=Phytophthora citrophthora TaxID=4793 RepID=A0AAD9G0N8_9STRA|nr:N-acetyltransferase family 8 member 2 [Phytophthora citrophthora]